MSLRVNTAVGPARATNGHGLANDFANGALDNRLHRPQRDAPVGCFQRRINEFGTGHGERIRASYVIGRDRLGITARDRRLLLLPPGEVRPVVRDRELVTWHALPRRVSLDFVEPADNRRLVLVPLAAFTIFPSNLVPIGRCFGRDAPPEERPERPNDENKNGEDPLEHDAS